MGSRRTIAIVLLFLVWGASTLSASQAAWYTRLTGNPSATRYVGVEGTGAASAESSRSTPIPGNATIKKIYAWCSADPGGSASWTIKLRDGGAAGPMTDSGFQVVLNAGETYDTTTADYSLHAGDLVDLSIIPASTPAGATIWACLVYEPSTANHYYLMGNYYNWTTYVNPLGPAGNMAQSTTGKLVMPHSGSVAAMYAALSQAPGTSNGRTCTIAIDGSAKDFVCTFGATDVTASDTSGTAAWTSAGSTLRVDCAITGTPTTAYVNIGVDVACDTANSFALFSGVPSWSVDADGYVYPHSQADHMAASTDADLYTPALNCQNLYVSFTGSPGTGETLVTTLVDDTSNTGLSATVSGSASTGSDTETVALAADSRFTLYIDLSAGANATRRYYGGMLVGFPTAPSQAASPDPLHEATGVSVNIDPSWAASTGATSYDVYFGTDATPDESEFIGNQPGTTYNRTEALANSTDYWWRIDAKNAVGTTEGAVWKLTTAAAPPAPGNPAGSIFRSVIR